jgi:hypothetical protein
MTGISCLRRGSIIALLTSLGIMIRYSCGCYRTGSRFVEGVPVTYDTTATTSSILHQSQRRLQQLQDISSTNDSTNDSTNNLNGRTRNATTNSNNLNTNSNVK